MELMKNGLSESAIQRIAKAFSQVLPSFNTDKFSNDVLASYEELELKERVNHIITQLHQQMPKNFVETVKIFEKIPAIWDRGDLDDPLRSFAAWPIIDYVGVHGLSHPQESLAILKQLTGLFSAEFAIRPFIKKYPIECHQQFLLWLSSDSEDVRRLISEGTRPR
jgi:3-methyladenine DNA glycosylase AlkC